MSKAKIEPLCDGKRSSREIAEILGVTPRYVRKVQKLYGFPQLAQGAASGSKNHQYRGGRHIDLDGYAVAQKGKNGRSHISEHRKVMSESLGRPLSPLEVVDHIDGLTLHNDPSNLRVFATNAEHLAATITGTARQWSHSGLRNIGARTDLGRVLTPVDTYRRRKERGDARLRQILLAALKLGIDSPHLSGTRRWLKKAQVDYSSCSGLEQGLALLESRYAEDLLK